MKLTIWIKYNGIFFDTSIWANIHQYLNFALEGIQLIFNFLAGADVLAGELSSQINSQCPNREFEHGGQVFSLDLRTISGDVDKPQNNFKTADFSPQGILILLLVLLTA